MPIVNKAELATLLDVSLPTLDATIRKDPQFPIVTRGRNGVEWQFDTEAVGEYVTQQHERELAEMQARAAELEQLQMPGLGLELPASGKAADLLNAVRAQKLQLEVAKQAGNLVWTHEVRQKLILAINALSRFMSDLPSQIGREMNLPDPVVAAMEARMGDAMVTFNKALGDMLAGPAEADAS